jgi:hypothetical protein
MIGKKLSLLTIHDENPSCSEKLQIVPDELNKLNIKYNLSMFHTIIKSTILRIIMLSVIKYLNYYNINQIM